MRPTLEALEQYLTDCETKRRRARDRPSNEVLKELRALLDQYHAVVRASGREGRGDEGDAPDADAQPSPLSVN